MYGNTISSGLAGRTQAPNEAGSPVNIIAPPQYADEECGKAPVSTMCGSAIRIMRETNDRFAHGLARLGAFADRVIGSTPTSANNERKSSPESAAGQLGDALAEYERLIVVLYETLKRIEQIA